MTFSPESSIRLAGRLLYCNPIDFMVLGRFLGFGDWLEGCACRAADIRCSDAYSKRGEGCISFADVRATLTTKGTDTHVSIHWEQAWEYRLRT